MIIVGVGGQGIMTLTKIIARIFLSLGYDFKTSELHGLSQRNGSIKTEIRAGKKKVFSPLLLDKEADLIIALEAQEAVNAIHLASEKTVFLINDYFVPTLIKDIDKKEVVRRIKKVSKKVVIVPASKIVSEEIGREAVLGMFLLSLATHKGLLPFSAEELEKAIKNYLPKRYLDLNIKALNLAKEKSKEF